MGAFDHLIPGNSPAGSFDHLIPPAPGEPTAGGVQDFEPIATRHVGTTERPRHASDYIGTQLTKAYTGMLGIPRAAADIQRWGGNALGLPEFVTNALVMANPMTAVGQNGTSSSDMNAFVQQKIGMPNVGSGSKILDAGVQAAMTAPAMPGTVARNVLPLLAGGAASEGAGQATAGTPYEIPARIIAGGGVGGATALAQNTVGSVIQGVRNIFPNIDETTAKIIGRAFERDKTTGPAVAAAQADLGPGAMLVEGGGPNVRGTLRGAIAAPGEARTNVQNAFDARLEGSNARTTAALDSAISPNNSLGTTVEELAAQRAKAARPLYEDAGIPRRIEATETTRPGAPVTRQSAVLDAEGRPMTVTEPGKPTIDRTFNTPNVKSEAIDKLLTESADVQAAIKAARKLPDFKDLPSNSMAMLDKAYKHLEGLEQAAVRAGNGARAFDLGNVRRDLRTALAEANPQYGAALEAFSGPSKLIDAATTGREWFTKNVDPKVASKEFAALSPAEQEAARVGIRDWARSTIGRSDRGTAAERVWTGGDHRARLEAILSPEGYAQLAKAMNAEKNAIRTSRDINVGSRTAPMGLEAADNAGQVNALADVGRGRFGAAAGKMLGNALGRIGEGRTEAVNARIAEMLTSTDPATVGLVASLAERARLAEAAKRSGRMNALAVGGFAPALGSGR